MSFLGIGLTFNWVSVKYFTKGWDFFIEEERKLLAVLCSLMVLFDILLGNGFSCMVTHQVIVIFFRRIIAGGICLSTKRLDEQTIVITGCNVGIGKETARELSKRGAKIIMACRDTVKAEKAAADIRTKEGGDVVVVKLDLASLASIRAFAEDLKAKEEKIHMLINNAGVMLCPYMKTADGFEMQIGTNHLGHFLLTNLLLPMLTHAEPTRIISLSSLAHVTGIIPFDDMNYEKGYDSYKAYANSKVANILFTRELAKKVKGTNTQVFSLHPGVVRSDLGRHIFANWTASILQVLQKTTFEGAQTTLHCALEADQDDNCYLFSDCEVSSAATYATDDGVAKKLWEVSENMVGLN